jgi:hypothetical protein
MGEKILSFDGCEIAKGILIWSILLLTATGCDIPDRVGRLEKENKELQAEMKKGNAVAEYDLQARCSKDARAWFNENWSRDKDTILLDQTNHYNKTINKCFIVTEFHYSPTFLEKGSWINDIEMTDVYENIKYGHFSEKHQLVLKPEYHFQELVDECWVYGSKCKTVEEFKAPAKQYADN